MVSPEPRQGREHSGIVSNAAVVLSRYGGRIAMFQVYFLLLFLGGQIFGSISEQYEP